MESEVDGDIPAGASFEAQAWATLRLCDKVAAHEGGSLAALVCAETAALLARPEAPLTAATDVYDVSRAITFLCGPGGGGRTRLGAYHTARFMNLGLQAERFVGKRHEETNAPQPPALSAREREGEAGALTRLLEQAAGHALYAEAAEGCAHSLAWFHEPDSPGEARLLELRAKVQAVEKEKEAMLRQRSRALEQQLRQQSQPGWHDGQMQQHREQERQAQTISSFFQLKNMVEKQDAIVLPSEFMTATFDASAFDPHIFVLMRQQEKDPGLLQRQLPLPTLDSLEQAAIQASERLLGQPQLPVWQKGRLTSIVTLFTGRLKTRREEYSAQQSCNRSDNPMSLVEQAKSDLNQMLSQQQRAQQQAQQQALTRGQPQLQQLQDQWRQVHLLLGRFQEEERGLSPEQRLDNAALPRFGGELGRLQIDISSLQAGKAAMQRLQEAMQALPPEQLLQRQSEAELDAVFAQMLQLEPRLLELQARQKKVLETCAESGKPGRGSMLDRIYGYHRKRCEAFFDAYFGAAARDRAVYRIGDAHHGVRLKLAQLHELQNVRAVAAPAPHARAAVAAPAPRGSGEPANGAAASLLAVIVRARGELEAATRSRDMALAAAQAADERLAATEASIQRTEAASAASAEAVRKALGEALSAAKADRQRAQVVHSSEAALFAPVIARAQADLDVATTRFNAQQAVAAAESACGEAAAAAARARGETAAAVAERDAARTSLARAEAALALSSSDAAQRDAALKALPEPRLEAHAAQLRAALEAADVLIAARKRTAAEAAAAVAARAAAEAKLCVSCIAAPKDTVLAPCGHKCVCSPCAAKLRPQLCPICRAPIASAVKVFES
jgi:hypothetical protein